MVGVFVVVDGIVVVVIIDGVVVCIVIDVFSFFGV